MIPGAVSQEVFEKELLPKILQQRNLEAASQPLVVPYCTVGFRSGLYCKDLVRKHGLEVRNGEGIIMWTFDGEQLVKPLPDHRAPPMQVSGAEREALGNASDASEGLKTAWAAVKEVHVYGEAWNMAADGYSTRVFSQTGGALRVIRQRCLSQKGRAVLAKASLWLGVFLLFYLFFTPACGIMYDCGCAPSLSKWGQVHNCNIFGHGERNREHRCPWCNCSGISCIFVCSDAKAFRGVPLLDLMPDGSFVTGVTVLVLHNLWKRVDRLDAKGRGRLAVAAKAALALLWFVSWCLVFGAIFFAASRDYPYFLGTTRS